MKKSHYLLKLVVLITLGSCAGGRFSTEYAAGYTASKPISCVPYAREASDFSYRGDAHTWWGQSQFKGNKPREGAVLVLAKTPSLTRGHVAVVTKIINDREVNVTHSNWGNDRPSRSVVYEKMRIQDVSPLGDWSQIRFWNHKAQGFGRPYPAYGFIYK